MSKPRPHTHVGLVLREKPKLDMAGHAHFEYFQVGDLRPTLVQPLGRGNTSPVKKLGTYVAYLCDGHDNGRYEDTWHYKFDAELESCGKDIVARCLCLFSRGETFDTVYKMADWSQRAQMNSKKKAIMSNWQTHERWLTKQQPAPALRPFQEKVLEKIEKQDDRKVLWVVDKDGDKGKTWMVKYLALYREACVMNNAKKADIACHYQGEDIVGMNLTRTVAERVNYEAIEMLKDGLVFDGKYESSCYVRPFDKPPPRIVVMSNAHPDLSAMSQDRWDIMEI